MPYLNEFLGFHREILRAFRSKDPQAAEDAIRRHDRRMIEIIKMTDWGIEEEPEAKAGA